MDSTSKKISPKEQAIMTVMEHTGWSHEEAEKKITDAKKRLGISYAGYCSNQFYRYSEEEQKVKYDELLRRRQEAREHCIQAAMAATGWSYETAEANIEKTHKRLKIHYKDYEKYQFYSLSEQQQDEKYQSILRHRKKVSERNDVESASQKDAVLRKLMKITGWDYQEALKKVTDAHNRTGCLYKEYLIYKFYELDEATQNELFLVSMSRKIVAKYDSSKETFMLFADKELTNTCFDSYLKRPWCVNTKISLVDFVEKFSNSTRLIYKPRRGARGNGVQAFDITPKNAKEVFLALANLPEGIVEQYVVQHPVLSSLSPSSVNTIRLATISNNSQPVTKDGKHLDVAYAALRIGGGTSIVDNFHSGGMAAAINLETGIIETDAADMDGNVFVHHPMSGTKIKGLKIPFFKEAVEFVKSACIEHNLEGYIGWDIAITENGPVLIEINLRPGVVLLTAPYISEKRGMKHVMEKYL